MLPEQLLLSGLIGLFVFAPSRGARLSRARRMTYPYRPPVIAAGDGARSNRSGYVRPMVERWPRRGGLRGLVDWLAVESSLRWLPRDRGDGTRATYCDHYFLDFFDQFYGPHVVPNPAGAWWTNAAKQALLRGETVTEAFSGARTLSENAARGTNEWLKTEGPSFGWQPFASAAELRAWVNATGRPGVVSTPTHVAVALPDSVSPETPGANVLLSQAGGNNRRFDRGNSWYRNNASVVYAGWSP
jgi:hypothetical protein